MLHGWKNVVIVCLRLSVEHGAHNNTRNNPFSATFLHAVYLYSLAGSDHVYLCYIMCADSKLPKARIRMSPGSRDTFPWFHFVSDKVKYPRCPVLLPAESSVWYFLPLCAKDRQHTACWPALVHFPLYYRVLYCIIFNHPPSCFMHTQPGSYFEYRVWDPNTFKELREWTPGA